MTICYFGSFDPNFSRNHILIDGLKRNQIKVIYCRGKGLALFRYLSLFRKFNQIKNSCDAIVVGVLGHFDLPIAWLCGLLWHKKIIFDAFISIYDTYVFDRVICSPMSLHAKWFWWIDKISCSLADVVLLDTHAHINYFVKTFHLPRRKFYHLPIGGDDTIFTPKLKTNHNRSKTIIEFHGMFTRLQGAEYFIQAAKKLESKSNLEFWLIGNSRHYRYPINLYHQLKPQNLKYFPRLSIKNLARKVSAADITIGQLGATSKAKRVFSFKIMHGLACGNAIIAPRVPPITKILKDRKNCLLISPGSVNELCRAIMTLSGNISLRTQIASEGQKIYQQQFSNYQLGKQFKQIILKQ